MTTGRIIRAWVVIAVLVAIGLWCVNYTGKTLNPVTFFAACYTIALAHWGIYRFQATFDLEGWRPKNGRRWRSGR